MEARILFARLPHNDKPFAFCGNAWETGKPLESSTENATLHKVLVWQEVLSQFLQVSSEVLS